MDSYSLAIHDGPVGTASEFHKGIFVIHKSIRDFSAMAIDQAHEQNNAVIKENCVLLA